MNIICKNEYTIRKVHADGHETTEAKFHNVCLQNFYNVLIGRVNYGTQVHSIQFGTGSREPSPSDTSLQSPLWVPGWNDGYNSIISWKKYLNEERHLCYKYTFKIPADQAHVGTVSEVGVALITGNPGLGLGTRALILDAEGNPMTITKTDLEVLYVDVIFEFTLQDSEHFTWCPENILNMGAQSGSGNAPMLCLGMFNAIVFMGGLKENGFNVRHAVLTGFTKNYSNNNHQLSVSGARLLQTTVTSQRHIKAIGIASYSDTTSTDYCSILGYWKFPDADVIPPKVLSGMRVGTGDGTTKTFNPPLAEWVRNTEEIFVNDVQLVRGVDYTCDCDYNAQGLIECSVLQDMEYIGPTRWLGTCVNTPVVGFGKVNGNGYTQADWNYSKPALTYAFPEDGVKAIRRFVFRNFIHYFSVGPGGSSSNSNWSGRSWKVEYSDDNETWTLAGACTMNSDQRAELVFENPVSARYWRFTVTNMPSNWTGISCGSSPDSIMAYGDQKPITFTEAPAEDAVITMNATVNCPMKNENFIIDVNPTFTV